MVAALGITIATLVAAGVGQDAVVRVRYRARRPNANEAPRLTVAWRMATHRMAADGFRLRIVGNGAPIATAGRRHLLLRRDIVAAYCANDLTAHHVAAILAEGVGRLHHGHTRFDLLWTVWTIPWDIIRGLARAIGRRLVWIPLIQFAWRTRLFVGVIAVVLEAQAGALAVTDRDRRVPLLQLCDAVRAARLGPVAEGGRTVQPRRVGCRPTDHVGPSRRST